MKTIPTSITANEFGTSADKIEPSPSLESAGYIPSQQLPAEHMNWFMSLLTRLANADNPSLRDIWSELNTLLTAAGLSADNATTTQVKAALDALYLLKSAYGANWLMAVQTALGTDWKTALAATAGAGILTELKKVDGNGSGLDTDLWRGVAPGTNWLTALANPIATSWLTPLTQSYDKWHRLTDSIAITDLNGGTWEKISQGSSATTVTMPAPSLTIDGTAYTIINNELSSFGITVQGAFYTIGFGSTSSVSLPHRGDYLKVHSVSGYGWVIDDMFTEVSATQTATSQTATGSWASAASTGLSLSLDAGIWDISLVCSGAAGASNYLGMRLYRGSTPLGASVVKENLASSAVVSPFTLTYTSLPVAPTSNVVAPWIIANPTTQSYISYSADFIVGRLTARRRR